MESGLGLSLVGPCIPRRPAEDQCNDFEGFCSVFFSVHVHPNPIPINNLIIRGDLGAPSAPPGRLRTRKSMDRLTERKLAYGSTNRKVPTTTRWRTQSACSPIADAVWVALGAPARARTPAFRVGGRVGLHILLCLACRSLPGYAPPG